MRPVSREKKKPNGEGLAFGGRTFELGKPSHGRTMLSAERIIGQRGLAFQTLSLTAPRTCRS